MCMEGQVVRRIKDRNEIDRPREKLLTLGRRVMSDAEILAILIGSGTKEENALQLSERILLDLGGDLARLSRLSVEQLCKYKGIGQAKALSIVAALELGRRKDKVPQKLRPTMNSSSAVYNYMKSTFMDLNYEESWVIYVDNGLKVIKKNLIGKGGIDFTPMDIKSVLKMGLECSARSFILAHNHPSGTLKASQADIDITYKILKASILVDMDVCDHLIFTDSGYFSFKDEGLLDFEK